MKRLRNLLIAVVMLIFLNIATTAVTAQETAWQNYQEFSEDFTVIYRNNIKVHRAMINTENHFTSIGIYGCIDTLTEIGNFFFPGNFYVTQLPFTEEYRHRGDGLLITKQNLGPLLPASPDWKLELQKDFGATRGYARLYSYTVTDVVNCDPNRRKDPPPPPIVLPDDTTDDDVFEQFINEELDMTGMEEIEAGEEDTMEPVYAIVIVIIIICVVTALLFSIVVRRRNLQAA